MTYLQINILLTGFFAAHTQFYQSYINMTTFGFEIQPYSPSDQLSSFFGMFNVKWCASQCNQQQLCRYFDDDTSTGACRIFFNGAVVASVVPTSEVGTVLYMSDLYSSHGEPCTWNNCEINRYLVCDSTNTCQCPTSLFWNGTMCAGMPMPTTTTTATTQNPYACGNMTILVGFDFDAGGYDITSTNLGNYSLCCDWCQSYAGCAAFTWRYTDGSCFLKDGYPTPSSNDILVSAHY